MSVVRVYACAGLKPTRQFDTLQSSLSAGCLVALLCRTDLALGSSMCLALSPPRRCPPPFLLLLFFASPSILCSRFLLSFHHFHTVPIPFLSTRSTLPSFPTRTHTKVPLLLAGPEQVLTLARILVLASIAAPSLSSQSPSLYQSIASLHLLFAPPTHLSLSSLSLNHVLPFPSSPL